MNLDSIKNYFEILNGLKDFEEDPETIEALDYVIGLLDKKLPVSKVREYVLYKGDDVIGQGNMEELAELIGVKPKTIRYYASPVNLKRIEKVRQNIKRKGAIKHYVAVKVDDNE